MDGSKKLEEWINVTKESFKHIFIPPSVISPPSKVIAKGDSAATNHYWRLRDKDVLTDVQENTSTTVILPDSTTISSTHNGQLPIPSLSKMARNATILPHLKSASLISLGQLCNDNCDIFLNKTKLFVLKNNELLLQGFRNKQDGLWDIPLPQPSTTLKNTNPLPFPLVKPPIQSASVILRKKQTNIDLVTYLHAACFSPVKSTFLRAIKNNHFTTWPGLTPEIVNKALPPSLATEQGHLNQERQNLQSTKLQTLAPIKIEDEDNVTFPTVNDTKPIANEVCYTLITASETNSKAYIDLTGRFPFQSSRGRNYILVAYHYDANAVLATALKNKSKEEIKRGWEELNTKCEVAGVKPKTYVMDNEASAELKQAMLMKNISYQLVPPHIHRTNLAERAIQTFKNHFKAGFASVDPKFPAREWDRLLPQAVLTLNLLRSSRNNPRLSAHAYLFGEFNFNATPLAPPGTKVLLHKKPDDRTSWGPHGRQGWYIGPALDHYRCVTCFVPDTRKELISDTVTFLPAQYKFPEIKTDDFLAQAATDIISILSKPPPSTVPSLEAGDLTRNALLKIAQSLNRVKEIPAVLTQPQPTSTPSETPQPTSTSLINDESPITAPPNTSLLPASPPALQSPPCPLPRVRATVPVSQQKTAPSPRVPTKLAPKVTLLSKPAAKSLRSDIPYLQQRYSLRSSQAKNYSHNFRSRAATRLLAQHLSSTNHPDLTSTSACMHIYNDAGKKQSLDDLLIGSDSEVWTKSLSNEIGRLAQGNIHGVKSTDTIDFIYKNQVPQDRKVTYANFDLSYRPLKTEKHRVRLVVGGDKLSYDDDSGSPAASLLETKVILNSVISDADLGARFMSCDLKDFFLATPMKKPEYMRIRWQHIPDDIKEKYNLYDKVHNGYIYVLIKRGMYGLKQAAVLAYEHLISNLSQHGYSPVPHTLGIWHHKTRRTKFCLCVDDFGVKYYTKDDAQHLIRSLEHHYTCTTDWTGQHFCGLNINWNYPRKHVDISMPGYIETCLSRFQHALPKRPQRSPHHFAPFTFGPKGTRQYANAPDQSKFLDKKGIKFVQSVVGSLLYYARAIDSTMLPALNDIASQQAQPTQRTYDKCLRLLDYAATYPSAYVRFHASDMVLRVDTDAAYLVMPKSRSRIAGYFYLGQLKHKPIPTVLNGAILVECKTLRHVVASAAEAEVGGIFHNAQMAIPIRNMLTRLGHQQPPTPIKTDNSTANGFVHDNINLKKSKSWDMRYYWLRDRQNQEQFDIYWESGKTNNGDYFTKHHPTFHHVATRGMYVKDALTTFKNSLLNMVQYLKSHASVRGCVDPPDIRIHSTEPMTSSSTSGTDCLAVTSKTSNTNGKQMSIRQYNIAHK
jgi:hypothetical protein